MTQDTKAVKKQKSTKYFAEVVQELKKVMWPSRSQLVNNTITVLLSCLLVGIMIWILDYGFQQVYAMVFNK